MQFKLNQEKIKNLLKNQQIYISFDEDEKKIFAFVNVDDIEFFFSKPRLRCKCFLKEKEFDYYIRHNKNCPNSTELLDSNQNLKIDNVLRKGFKFDYVDVETSFFKRIETVSINLLKFSIKNDNFDFQKMDQLKSISYTVNQLKFYSDLIDLLKEHGKQSKKRS